LRLLIQAYLLDFSLINTMTVMTIHTLTSKSSLQFLDECAATMATDEMA